MPEKKILHMRDRLVMSVLAVVLLLTACKRELNAPDPISIVVTTEDVHGKMIQFIYQNKLVWESEMGINGMTYRQEGDLLYIEYLSPTGKRVELVFKEGRIVGKT